MNKLCIALSFAAVAALTGCLDPQYTSRRSSRTEPTRTVAPKAEPKEDVKVEPVKDSEIKVDVADDVAKDGKDTAVQAPAEVKPEYTDYIIQRGDTLSKISKRYNITIAAIKAANPQIKNDVVKLGQKIKLPGKVDVGEQSVPAGAFEKNPAPGAKGVPVAVKPYTGETKKYVIKNGDTLGKIAKTYGISVAQLKELNSLKSNLIVVGKELKVPASKDAGVKAPAAAKVDPVEKKDEKPAEEIKAPAEQLDPAEPIVVDKPVEAPAADPAEQPVVEAPAENDTLQSVDYEIYTVQDDDDITGISITKGCSKDVIMEINNLPDETLKPGMQLKLPRK